ncbi:hypothetical protein [Chondrinema litorale]|uniref:hypothetical protein n=1 Tax=Chondrinema litorale TaxID=2994555 RepID=UPI0025439202|nr:hypothetical protein [Chondrinema litorale]UZR95150.1 hypothetical protein OQ292_04880 [Chondrinema litorale]
MKLYLFLISLLTAIQVSAQSINFSNENFAFEVKQIDEFIERFNNSEKTLINQYLKENYSAEDISRSDLIKSLFNQSDKSWKLNEVTEFIKQVNNKPYMLHFDDEDWYAKLNCTVIYQGDEIPMTMIMNIEKNPRSNAVKWVITSVDADFLSLPESLDKSKSINPASHGTNFVSLDRALDDTSNMKNYVSRDFVPDQLTLFMSLLSCKNISIKQVDKIEYHFLQIDGWTFTVKNFERNEKNSGWLVSSLTKMDDHQKNEFKKRVLNLK